MSRQQDNGIYALIGGAAVIMVAVLVGMLFWNASGGDGIANGATKVADETSGKQSAVPSPPARTDKPDGTDDKAVAPPIREGKSDATVAPPQGTAVKSNEPAAGDGKADGASGQASSDTPDKPRQPEGQAESQDKSPVASGKPVSSSDGEGTVEGKDKAPASTSTATPSASAPDNASPPKSDDGKPAGIATPSVAPPLPAEQKPEETAEKPDAKAIYPSFDHVRIEPNGENIFAGRVAPGATVEMIRDGEVYARTVSDPSGLFALSAPALPVGASNIYLQSIAPDGRRENSKESVTVMISQDRARRPLVALASPDKPTVVLSNPDSPDGRKPETGDILGGSGRPDIQIVSVEARDGGRLFVSGLASPGASVKLYLNGSMVAPGGADSEGKLSFAIARGMIPGDYQVRLDDVDPVSGQVKSQAEVHFKIPETSDVQVAQNERDMPKNERDMPKGDIVVPCISVAAPAAIPSIETTTVRRGDSLWLISQKRYGTGYLYLEIYDANLRKVKNPDVIYPGQVLVLPPLEYPGNP